MSSHTFLKTAVRVLCGTLVPVGGNLIADAAFAVLPELANILPEGVESVLKSLKDGGSKEVAGLLTTNFDEYLKSREGKVSSHLERTIAKFWAEKLGDRILSRQNTMESMSGINPGRLDLEDEITLLECWQKRIKDACEKNFSALDDLFDYSGNLTIIDAIGDERDAEEFFWIGLKVNLLSWANEDGIPEAEGKLSGGMEKELKKPFFEGLKNKIGQVIQEDTATREAFKYAAAFQTIDLIKRLAEKTDVNFGELKFDLSKLQIDVGQMMETQQAIRAETASPLRAIQMLLEERFPEMLERIEDKIDRMDKKVDESLALSRDSNELQRDGYEILVEIKSSLQKGNAEAVSVSVESKDIGGSIDFAEIVTGRSDNLAIDVIRGINAQAAVLYQRIVLKQDVVVRHGEIWRNFWQPYEFETQRNYANTRLINGEFVQDRICSRLMEAFSETESFGIANQTRLWLIGGAGVGKTSSLYHTYFKIVTSDDSYPIPLLLQPRLFDEKAVNRLDHIEDDAEFLEQLMIIWLENRSIRLPAANLPDFLDGLKKALGNGKIAILIDSYDELARFKFQTQIFRSLINGTQVCVCASRPETYDNNEKDNDILKIEDAWELETVKQFLGKRIPAENAFSGLLLRYISENQSADWLRNPRYLDLFVRINDDMFAGNGLNRSEETLTDILKGGGYALLKRIHDEAVDRLRRNLPQNSPLKIVDRNTFERETTKRFCDIALTELTLGARNLSTDDYENDPYWRAVCSATDFLQKPFLNRVSGSYKLKFLNYNFVDYFLTEEIALRIYTDDKPIEHFHQWSNTLVSYLVQYFFDDKENFLPKTLQTQVKKKLKSYGTSAAVAENGYRAVSDFEPACCFMGVNLMKLLIKLINRDENDLLAPEFMGEEYKGLYLKGVDLSGMRFIECDFTGSILENSIFEKTEFNSCNFSAVNFRESRAFQASFMECDFDFPDGPRDDSAVNGMIVHSVEFTGCKNLKREKVGPETFLDFGARIKESRYAGEFGRRFRKQMADFLGEGFKMAARIYIEEIGNALTPVAGTKEDLYLIDIMAGDMSRLFQEEILLKFNKLSKLNLLAIDKDASTINQDVKFSEADRIRINIWEKEIEGLLGLKREFNSRFNVDHADLIIGKKALHEIKREYQQQIFFELSECLGSDGRLVLYMDSSAYMSEKGFEKQGNFVEKIRKKTDNYELRRILMEELVFSGEADDACVFTNIWVAIKDYANENEHELQNRYFAGVNEITEWAKAAGLQVNGEIKVEKSNLMPKLFNENGFNKICSFIKDNPDMTISGNDRSIEETLLGTKRHRLLRDFTWKHLWDERSNSPTALGRTLSAKKEPVQFRKIHPALADFSFFREEENQDINFSLPAHIGTFAKAV